MKNLEYKGYTGTIEYSQEDKLLYGKVLGIRGLISYEGSTGQKLEKGFQEAIDIYLTDCKEMGIKPEKAFKGSFNVRVSAEIHKAAALQARDQNTSLNNLVAHFIELGLDKGYISRASNPKNESLMAEEGSTLKRKKR